MDRDAVARAGRRAQAEDALVFEREREATLRRQVAELILEEDGPRVDAAALETLDEDDVRRVRAALGEPDTEDAEEDLFGDEPYVVFEPDEQEDAEDEVSRLQSEIEESLLTQAALERFIAALDAQGAPTEAAG